MLRLNRVLAGAFLAYSLNLSCQDLVKTPEIAPGIVLPTSGSVVALDATSNGPQLSVLHASEVKSNSHAGGNFARSMVYAGPHSGIELAGQHASIALQSARPILYLRLSADEPELQRSRATLLMLRAEKDSREIMQFSSNIFGGSRKRKLEEVAVTKEDLAGGAWLKITPNAPLEAGEYALTILPKDSQLFSDVIYDFSVRGQK